MRKELFVAADFISFLSLLENNPDSMRDFIALKSMKNKEALNTQQTEYYEYLQEELANAGTSIFEESAEQKGNDWFLDDTAIANIRDELNGEDREKFDNFDENQQSGFEEEQAFGYSQVLSESLSLNEQQRQSVFEHLLAGSEEKIKVVLTDE